ncbi:MAG: ATP phosphoribosyltransferase [Candidatus Dormibacteraceae bacterium]
MRLAVPNKGRLAEPSLALLREAGFRFEAADRRLFARCDSHALDLLFVRAEDIPEYAQDGIADLGITGTNLLLESGADVEVRLPLGFGRCSLRVAVPQEASITSPAELAGHAVATSHPQATGRFFEGLGASVRLIEIKGAVEVAPLIGVADAIVDLVSTGSTLAINGLRTIATVADFEAALISGWHLTQEQSRGREQIEMALNSVIAAGRRKYLMMNAPAAALERIREIIPGLGAPTVMELSTPGQIAVHAVVESDLVWELLSPLKSAGASSILVMQIENLIP